MRALKMSPDGFNKKQIEMKSKHEKDEKSKGHKVFKNKRARTEDDEDDIRSDAAQPGSPADKS